MEEHWVHAQTVFTFASRNALLSSRTKGKEEWETSSSTFSPCLAPEAAGTDGEDADENSMSTNNIVKILSNDKKQVGTGGKNNQHLDFADFYNAALTELLSPLID